MISALFILLISRVLPDRMRRVSGVDVVGLPVLRSACYVPFPSSELLRCSKTVCVSSAAQRVSSGVPKVLSFDDKKSGNGAKMSDVAFAQEIMREAFPRSRHGSVKAAVYAAFRFIQPKVQKDFTVRRARSIWEGTARRIDAEEKDALVLAQIEEARREQIDLRQRLARLDTALAAIDEDFHGPQMAAHREAAARLGRVYRARAGGDAR